MIFMDLFIDALLFAYFNGDFSVLGENFCRLVSEIYDQSDDVTKKVVDFRYSGGSYKDVPSKLFISTSCYYFRLGNFVKKVKDRKNCASFDV